MKFLKRNANVILLCLFEALIGVLLVVDPIGFTSGIIIVFGMALLIAGLICTIGYFRSDAVEAALRGTLVKGLALLLKTGIWFLPAISAVVSIICAFVVLSNPFASTLVLWMFTGISLIVEAVLDVAVLFFGRGGMSDEYGVK